MANQVQYQWLPTTTDLSLSVIVTFHIGSVSGNWSRRREETAKLLMQATSTFSPNQQKPERSRDLPEEMIVYTTVHIFR